MARRVLTIRKKTTTTNSFVRDLNEEYEVIKSREDDFHVNPSECTGLPEVTQEALRCSICKRFPTEYVFEGERKGSAICEDCFSLNDPLNGCQIQIDDWYGTRCCNGFSSRSLAAENLLFTIQYRCLVSACPGPCLDREEGWKAHLEHCKFLNNYVQCPDALCDRVSIPRHDFVSHCEETHGLLLLMNFDLGKYRFDLEPAKFKNGPSLAMIFKCDNHILYMVGKSDDSSICLAVFITERDMKWASAVRMKVATKGPNVSLLSARLKINPAQREWYDVKIFGRSQTFWYDQLDTIFCVDKDIPVAKKRYRLELEMMDVSDPKVILSGTWEDLEECEVHEEVKDNSSVKSVSCQPTRATKSLIPKQLYPPDDDDDDKVWCDTFVINTLHDDPNLDFQYDNRCSNLSNVRTLHLINRQ